MSEPTDQLIELEESAGSLSPSREGNGLVVAALVLPVPAGAALFFVNSLPLAWGISLATIVTTATLIAIDARRLGNVDLNGRIREFAGVEGAGALLVGMIMLWIVVYPLAFFRRRYFARPNLTLPAVAVAAFFALGPLLYSTLVPPGLPSCTSPETIQLLGETIRQTPVGASLNSIDGYCEVSYDRDAKVRHGRCVVHTDAGDFKAEYFVKWLERNKRRFTVGVPMSELPSCGDPEVVRCLEQLLSGASIEGSGRSTDRYDEASYDPVAFVRHCRCIVSTDAGDAQTDYLVTWLDPFKAEFEVQLLDE